MKENSEEMSGRVLIVDDNPKNLQVLGKFLRNENFGLEFAVDGNAALEWLEIRDFDLVLLDVNMPGMDGFEVCRKIRSNPKLDKMPVFFLTAETLRESVLKGFETGAQDYITKPFDSRELISRVKTHITLKRSLEKLEQLNLTLEEKVNERTKELSIAKEKAEESDKLKTAFLVNISHEIRTPLNGIMGALMLLKGEDIDRAKRLECINMASYSGHRLLGTINDIIEISRIEAGSFTVERSRVYTDDFIRAQYTTFKPLAEGSGLDIAITEMVRGEEAVVHTDGTKFARILEILLKNALKYTPKGSIEMGSYMDDDTLVVFVRDTGVGIPPGHEEVIFKRFVQADMSFNRGYEGAGIGLSIAKAYAEALHGRIWFSSEIGKGSTFFFSLPAR